MGGESVWVRARGGARGGGTNDSKHPTAAKNAPHGDGVEERIDARGGIRMHSNGGLSRISRKALEPRRTFRRNATTRKHYVPLRGVTFSPGKRRREKNGLGIEGASLYPGASRRMTGSTPATVHEFGRAANTHRNSLCQPSPPRSIILVPPVNAPATATPIFHDRRRRSPPPADKYDLQFGRVPSDRFRNVTNGSVTAKGQSEALPSSIELGTKPGR